METLIFSQRTHSSDCKSHGALETQQAVFPSLDSLIQGLHPIAYYPYLTYILSNIMVWNKRSGSCSTSPPGQMAGRSACPWRWPVPRGLWLILCESNETSGLGWNFPGLPSEDLWGLSPPQPWKDLLYCLHSEWCQRFWEVSFALARAVVLGVRCYRWQYGIFFLNNHSIRLNTFGALKKDSEHPGFNLRGEQYVQLGCLFHWEPF